MDDTSDIRFRNELYGRKYVKCQKYLIPRDVYNSTIEDLNQASQESSAKSRHDY